MPTSVIDVTRMCNPYQQVFTFSTPVDEFLWSPSSSPVELWGYNISSEGDGEIQLLLGDGTPISPIIFVEPRALTSVGFSIPICKTKLGIKIKSNINDDYSIQLLGYML